jgi:putative ABC transport system permease protein
MFAQKYILGIDLAVRDYRHEWRLSLCAVLGLASVLAPMLVLYALKFGIVDGIREQLSQEPRARELRLVGHGSFDEAFFARLRSWPEVGFLLPATRFLAATLQLRREEAGTGLVTAEMWPSGKGDPLLGTLEPVDGLNAIVSRSLAEKLGVRKGDAVRGQIGRSVGEQREVARIGLIVGGVLDATVTDRDVILVSLPFLVAAEDWREGSAVPAYDWPGQPLSPGPRSFASFRLFAKDIDSVERLRDTLVEQGLDIQSRAADIQLVRKLDDNLMLLFSIVAMLGMTGCIVGLGMTLWAAVERKRKEIAVMQLLGLHPSSLAIFPIAQAVLTSSLGVAVAFLAYAVIAPVLNGRFATGPDKSAVVAKLDVSHLAIALAVTVAAAIVASLAASFRVLRQQASEGLRHDGA